MLENSVVVGNSRASTIIGRRSVFGHRCIVIRIANAQVWVHDQEEALAFYTQKLGMEVRTDVSFAEMGDFRWLTVGPPGQPDVAIVLMAIRLTQVEMAGL